MPKRRNGLAAPHSKMQISTWLMLPALMLEFFFFCSANLPLIASILVTCLFLGTCIAACLFGYLATALDPMDPRLSHDNNDGNTAKDVSPCCYQVFSIPQRCIEISSTRHNDGNGANNIRVESGAVSEERTKYCWVCEQDVAEHSMHCKYCNKCVAHFDHHCQWLNTCVGSRNYPFFRKTLWSIAAVLIVHSSVGLGIAIDILVGGTSKQRAEQWFSADLPELVVATLLVFSLLDFLAMVLIVQLLLFHLKLSRLNLTTYQFILRDNAEKRERLKVERERESRRIVAIGNAKRNQQHCKFFMLAIGGQLGKIHSCLDVLPDEEDNQNQETNATRYEETKLEEEKESESELSPEPK
mmetsp:Transcript_26841/g.40626  ORF Transcript_26841/g.40626 Transcript_26841/m.40626 type:complete len:355 (+) Transcript_26841:93-1157(+)